MGGNVMLAGLARLALYIAPILVAAFAAFLYFGGDASASAQSGSVQVVGSETVRPVMTACAEEFMTRNPHSDIIVRGGGSGDGIAAILHGITDIGMTSREITQREHDFAVSKGIDLSTVDLARDGVTVVVNRANSVDALDFDQLRDVFTGKTRNWRELGGADAEIILYARAAGSGTSSLFEERVLGERPYDRSVQRLATNEAIVAEVAARPGALGYTGFAASRGAGDRLKAVALRKDPQAAPVTPSAETILTGNYPLARTLHLGVAGKPAGTVRGLLDFCTSTHAQALIQRAGYVAIATGAR